MMNERDDQKDTREKKDPRKEIKKTTGRDQRESPNFGGGWLVSSRPPPNIQVVLSIYSSAFRLTPSETDYERRSTSSSVGKPNANHYKPVKRSPPPPSNLWNLQTPHHPYKASKTS